MGVVAGGTGRRVVASKGASAMERSRSAVGQAVPGGSLPGITGQSISPRDQLGSTLMTARWDSR